MPKPIILPPMGLLIALLLMLASHFILPIIQILPGIWRLTGLLPIALGLIFSYAAENQFQKNDTTVNPFKQSSLLVTDGLYRFSRNPMYLGMVLILAGVALLLGSLTPICVIMIYVIWISHQFIRIEEKTLLTQFGQDWLEYKARVRRWI